MPIWYSANGPVYNPPAGSEDMTQIQLHRSAGSGTLTRPGLGSQTLMGGQTWTDTSPESHVSPLNPTFRPGGVLSGSASQLNPEYRPGGVLSGNVSPFDPAWRPGGLLDSVPVIVKPDGTISGPVNSTPPTPKKPSSSNKQQTSQQGARLLWAPPMDQYRSQLSLMSDLYGAPQTDMLLAQLNVPAINTLGQPMASSVATPSRPPATQTDAFDLQSLLRNPQAPQALREATTVANTLDKVFAATPFLSRFGPALNQGIAGNVGVSTLLDRLNRPVM